MFLVLIKTYSFIDFTGKRLIVTVYRPCPYEETENVWFLKLIGIYNY